MRLSAAGRNVLVVLMGAMASSERTLDALNIQRWLGAPDMTLASVEAAPAPHVRKVHKVALRRRHR